MQSNPSPITRMEFKKSRKKTPYLLVNSHGRRIDLCGQYTTGENKGQYYLLVETTQNPLIKFSHSIYTKEPKLLERRRKVKPYASKVMVGGFNLPPENPYRAWSDFPPWNMALLFEFSPDFEKLSIWFFENARSYAKTLFERWVSGNLDLTVQSNKVPLRYPAGNKEAL